MRLKELPACMVMLVAGNTVTSVVVAVVMKDELFDIIYILDYKLICQVSALVGYF